MIVDPLSLLLGLVVGSVAVVTMATLAIAPPRSPTGPAGSGRG